jgi:hypothetical protein
VYTGVAMRAWEDAGACFESEVCNPAPGESQATCTYAGPIAEDGGNGGTPSAPIAMEAFPDAAEASEAASPPKPGDDGG